MPKDEMKISLSEFVKQEMALLERFEMDWFDNHLEDPEDWPMKMHPGDWDEQFRAWHDDCGEPTPEDCDG